jgi:hypothetical protein
MRAGLNLDLFAPSLKEAALEDLEQGDVLGFLGKADNTVGLYIVAANGSALKERGLYEQALLHAWAATRTNYAKWPASHLRALFDWADKAKLRALGDPLPGPGPFVLYRGIAGTGAFRKPCGISWTSDFDTACWFADHWGMANQVVLCLQVDPADVVTYLNDEPYGRGESEVLVLLPRGTRPAIHTDDRESIRIAAARRAERDQAARAARLAHAKSRLAAGEGRAPAHE